MAAQPVGLTFVPHLTPMIRGIHATLYARIKNDADFQQIFEERYSGEAFVDVLPPGSHPDTRSVRAANRLPHRPASTAAGQGPGRACRSSTTSSKGAAGQAVQNMNIMFGLPETEGLWQLAVLP
jgi:N-acetyl-gamma-glutamyl-phosphate reductase